MTDIHGEIEREFSLPVSRPAAHSTPHPFTQEDAAAWANVCYRLSLRWGNHVTGKVLRLSMDVNWNDALAMWAFTRERGYVLKFGSPQLKLGGMRALNNSRAFGLTDARSKYSAHLYQMLKDDRRVQG
jgi:hypothetical protein